MNKIVLLPMMALFLSCGQKTMEKEPTALLIGNVTVVDVTNGNLIAAQQVLIDSGLIKKITGETISRKDYATQINGTGKYLIPGLAEMHSHIPQPPTSTKRIEETLFLYLSNGVTTIRGMLGHPDHLKLKENAKNGTLLSPRIFTSSPSLNGNSVTTKEQANELVNKYRDEGYDFLKIHPGIALGPFNEIVRTANKRNIRFAGHVPVDVGIQHALESKFASIDHVDGFLEGLVPEREKVDPHANGFFGFDFTDLADTTQIDDLVSLSKENEVWIVPTQSLFERWFAPITSEELLQQPEMKYMPATTLEAWRKRKEASTGPNTTFDEGRWNRFIAIRKQLIRKLQSGGHGLLLGSDAPQLFNVPGFSIHHEIAGMQRAGLAPLEILQSGTINPALFFEMENFFGQVKEGLEADLVLLDANPLEDLKALKQIRGVLIGGRYLSKEDIQKKLEEIAKEALQE